MADPEAAVVIKGGNQTSPAFEAALADMKAWSDSVKGEAKAVKDSVSGMRETFELAGQVLKGFGAVQLGRELAHLAGDAYAAAEGLGQFVLDAEAAGAGLDAGVVSAARDLVDYFRQIREQSTQIAGAIAGPFIVPIRDSMTEFLGWTKRNREELQHLANFVGETGVAIGNGLTTAFAPLINAAKGAGVIAGAVAKAAELAGSAVGGDQPVQSGERLRGREGEVAAAQRERERREARADRAFERRFDFADDEFFSEKTQKGLEAKDLSEKQKAAQEARHRAQEISRQRDHLAKLQSETRLFYDQQQLQTELREQKETEQRTIKEDQKRLREVEHARGVMESLAFNHAQRLDAIAAWEQRETSLVGANEEARLRIHQEANRRRRTEETNERQGRLARERETLTQTVSLLGAAFGQTRGVRIAEGLVNTYTGVTAALARGPAGIPMAAIILAKGLHQVSAIKSTNPGSGGSGGGSLGGGPTPPAEFSGPRATSAAPAPVAMPSAATAPQLSLVIKGSILTPSDIYQGTQDFLELAGRDGRTSIVVKQA